jgi:hypothetical protein
MSFFSSDLLSDEAFSDNEDDDEASDSSQSDDSDKRAEAQARLVPPLPESEYGVMPASYSNSQRVSAPTIATETVPRPSADTPDESKPIRRPILMRDKFDGVDSDDETDSENELVPIGENDEDEDEDKPTVVGDVEVDMEAEEEEFLQFSREALGISRAQWDGILSDRAGRGGAFYPSALLISINLCHSLHSNFSGKIAHIAHIRGLLFGLYRISGPHPSLLGCASIRSKYSTIAF